MGRRKKNATIASDVSNFTVTKEESLSVFTKELISVPQEVIDLYDVKPVWKSNLLSGEHIEQFNGKNYSESLKLAHEWQDRVKTSNKRVEFVNYYPQEFQKKSILIGYNIITTE